MKPELITSNRRSRQSVFIVAGFMLCGLIGCGGGGSGQPFARFMESLGGGANPTATNSPPAPTAIVSTPLPSQPPAEDAAPDSDLSQLNDRIAQYAGKFPDGTPARESAAASPPPASAWQPLSQRETASPPMNAAVSYAPPPQTPVAPTAVSPPPAPAANNTTSANAAVAVGSINSPQISAPPSPSPTAKQDLKVALVDIRPATVSPPSASAAATANQGTGPSSASPAASLADVVAAQEKLAAQNPRNVQEQIKLRLLYLAAGQNNRAGEPVNTLDSTQSDLLAVLTRVWVATTTTIAEPTQPPAPALAAVGDLQRLLARQAPVSISKMALVTSINSFGDYKEVQPARFPPGRPLHVFCYVEVNNFTSQPTTEGRSRTLLGAKLEIFDAAGQRRWDQAIAKIEDLARTPRRDFFLPLEIKTPAEFSAGEYVLKVTIDDQLGATSDQHRLNFTIGS